MPSNIMKLNLPYTNGAAAVIEYTLEEKQAQKCNLRGSGFLERSKLFGPYVLSFSAGRK